jgi:hypothetical protein
MTAEQLAWLAGLLEGEGSFMKGPPSKPGAPCVAVSMTDRDVVERAAALMGVSCQGPYLRKNLKVWKPYYMATVRGYPAADLMKLLRDHMGARRRAQIDAAMATFSVKHRQKIQKSRVLEIKVMLAEGRGDREVARHFRCAHSLIGRIRRGESYAQV